MAKSKNNVIVSVIAVVMVASIVLNARVTYLPQVSPVTKVFADQGGNPGSVWTTNVSCGGININIFDAKSSVFLNGGPNGGSPNGLPDGYYFVMVTDPSTDALLGHVSASGAVHVTNGRFDVCYNLFDLTAFTDTPNAGGEYKVTISQSVNFDNGSTKSDNFKVNPGTSASPSGSPSASPSQSPNGSPSTSPSSSPANSASPAASPSENPGSSVTPSASPSVSPSVAPSVSPSPANSATPAPSNDNHNNNNDNNNDNNTSDNASEGQILGAYADTGVVQDAIMNVVGSIGGLMTSIGAVLYGQKKNKKK